MTAPRIIVSGATTAITKRCNMRKAFLAPWHPWVSDIWLYALADAQRRTGVAIHHGQMAINHHHLTATPQFDNLPRFTELLHTDLSKALNALLVRERYDAPRELLDSREPHYMRLLDAPVQASRMVYDDNNCVAAGLVNRPEHMPGRVLHFDLWLKGYLDVKKPPVYFGKNRPEVLRLYLTPPPLLFAAFDGDLKSLAYHMKRLNDDAGRKLRDARRRPPIGARQVQRIHPWSEPKTLREPGGQPAPTFGIGARDILGRRANVQAALEVRGFRAEHQEMRLRRKQGDFHALFPFGTYAMRVHHNANVAAAPYPDALVTQPGPTLDDIMAESGQRGQRPVTEGAIELLQEVRTAIAELAADLCKAAELDIPQRDTIIARSTAGADEHPPRKLAEEERLERKPLRILRQRFNQRDNPKQHARRLVVLRDRRRGRPPSHSKRGTDPPA